MTPSNTEAVGTALAAVRPPIRTTQRLVTAILAFVLVLPLTLTASAARGSTAPNATLWCGGGQVATSGPRVEAQQSLVADSGYDVWWIAELVGWNGSTWQTLAYSQWLGDDVQSDGGFSLGQVWGTAGPEWAPPGVFLPGDPARGPFNEQRWNVQPGYWYGIINWVYDRGQYISATAFTAGGSGSCFQ